MTTQTAADLNKPLDPIRFHGVMFDLTGQIPTMVNVKPDEDGKPVMIYDLDGTLADDTHRRHFVEGDKKDYIKYYSLIKNDKPNWPVVEELVRDQMGGATIVVITGREDTYLMSTLQQLYQFQIHDLVSCILMRPTGNYTKAADFKRSAIGLLAQDGMAIAKVVDDSPEVRAMAEELKLVAVDPAELILDDKAPRLILPPGVR
jgi:hypothetical protein